MASKTHLLHIFLSFHLVGLFRDVESVRVDIELYNNKTHYFRSFKSPAYPLDAAPGTEITWEVRGPKEYEMELVCTDITLPKRANCSEGVLSIKDQGDRVSICSITKDYQRNVIGGRMSIVLKTGQLGIGRISCFVILGSKVSGMNITQDGKHTSCPCGQTNKMPTGGAQEKAPNEFPFIAIILPYLGPYFGMCAGTILTQRHILTAAHCVWNRTSEELRVEFGVHYTVKIGNAGHTIGVSEIIVHENFNHETHSNDIGLLVLADDIKFWEHSGNVAQICLPRELYPLAGHFVTAIGWGTPVERCAKYPASCKPLKSLTMKVPESETCTNFNNKTISIDKLTQLCTAPVAGSNCTGDSGGPILYQDPELNAYVQVGILPSGDCKPGENATGTLVYGFFDWIQSKIGGNFSFKALSGPRQPNTCEKLELLL